MLSVAFLFPFAAAQEAASLCHAETTPIGAIQGAERRSPLAGETVTLSGIVTATFRDEDSLGGVFVQDADADGDLATSDGIFIRLRERSEVGNVNPVSGERIVVRGVVFERNEMTQLDRLEALELCGYEGLVEASEIALPVADATAWESYEGMLVRFAEPLTITEVYNLGRYGELLLATDRLFIPTNFPGGDSQANALRQITLNDASTVENPEPVPFLGPDLTVRVGDTVRDLTAIVVNHGLQAYRLEPAAPPLIERTNPRPAQPDPVGGSLRVAGFNVLNYFTSLNERGADNPEELERQTQKLVAALAALDADAFGWIELENNGTTAAQALVDALNAAVGGAYVVMPDPRSGAGTDQIKQGIVYRSDVLELVGSASDSADIHDRFPIAATFRHRESGEVFSMIVVHFKSKGGCPPAGDLDEGYGCWNLLRSAQAQATIDFAEQIAASTGDPDVLIVGDLNSYRIEPPVVLFERAGYVNLDERLPEGDRYTYVFFGESGTLDYMLASESLAGQVTGMTNWHINADEPPVTDYDLTYNPAEIFRPFPFRSSDHDPVLVGLELR